MIRVLGLLMIGLGLSACETASSTNYICVNGPDITAVNDDVSVLLMFQDGRDMTLRQTSISTPNVYAGPAVRWTEYSDSARLDDGRSSYLCNSIG